MSRRVPPLPPRDKVLIPRSLTVTVTEVSHMACWKHVVYDSQVIGTYSFSSCKQLDNAKCVKRSHKSSALLDTYILKLFSAFKNQIWRRLHCCRLF